MSKVKQRKNNRQVKLLVGSAICLLLIMTVGYAAFSTKLTIGAKGNIKTLTAANFLLQNVVTEGDGLYVAESNKNLRSAHSKSRYIYKGQNPNNNLTFNNENWKIISVEEDGSVKIIKESPLDIELPWDSNKLNTWENSTIQDYLNNTYLNQMADNSKKQVVEHAFNIGAIKPATENMKITNDELQIAEASKTWNGYIGLINISDYITASNDTLCTSVKSLNDKDLPCYKSNYLYKENTKFWFINSVSEVQDKVWHFSNSLEQLPTFEKSSVYPVLYLDGNISLQGDGTSINPYTIKSSN